MPALQLGLGRPYQDGETNREREREIRNTSPLKGEKPSTQHKETKLKITTSNRKTSTPQNPHAENAILERKTHKQRMKYDSTRNRG